MPGPLNLCGPRARRPAGIALPDQAHSIGRKESILLIEITGISPIAFIWRKRRSSVTMQSALPSRAALTTMPRSGSPNTVNGDVGRTSSIEPVADSNLSSAPRLASDPNPLRVLFTAAMMAGGAEQDVLLARYGPVYQPSGFSVTDGCADKHAGVQDCAVLQRLCCFQFLYLQLKPTLLRRPMPPVSFLSCTRGLLPRSPLRTSLCSFRPFS